MEEQPTRSKRQELVDRQLAEVKAAYADTNSSVTGWILTILMEASIDLSHSSK